MITELQLDNQNVTFDQYEINGSDSHRLTGLKKINVFVGANNSGKSRFLRELFISFATKEISNEDSFDQIDFPFIEIKKANKEFDELFSSYLKFAKPTLNNTLEGDKKVERFKSYFPPTRVFKGQFSFKEYTKLLDSFDFKVGAYPEVNEEELLTHNNKHTGFIEDKNDILRNISYSVYIPILRSLKIIIKESKPLKVRVHSDYFRQLDFSKSNIFTGEDLYKTINEAIKYGRNEKKRIKEFEDFLNDSFFKTAIELNPLGYIGKDENGKNKPNTNQDLFIKYGQEPDFSIPYIGDGIQALIILTFHLFLHADKNLLLFIEEPELNLHPGLQRLFLETLNNNMFKNTQIFFTTHSNHFLDLAIETSPEMAVFSFEKKPVLNNKNIPQFKISDITKRSFDALNLLGVNSSSVFLSNCTIWIEGISDRMYIRKYLEIYQKKEYDKNKGFTKFNEDIHYSFIEYAGNNITHWSFLDIEDDERSNHKKDGEKIKYKSISKKIFLITDKDRGKEKRHKKLEKNLGDNYCCLNCLEIENLLKPEVLKTTIEKYAKNRNEKIKFKEIKIQDDSNNEEFIYSLKDIGEFIYSSVIVDENQIFKIASKPKEDKETRKIRDKYKFAKNAIDSISCWEDMSEEAQDLAEKIYQFIKNNNKS